MSAKKKQPKDKPEGQNEKSKQDSGQELNNLFKEMIDEAVNAIDTFGSLSEDADEELEELNEELNEGLNEGLNDGSNESSEEALEQENEKAYQELLDRYQRTLAEFDNFRKRTLKEKAGAYDGGVRDTVEKLLPILDNFDRALAASEDKEDTFYQGIAMISRQLEGYLADLGVEIIESCGAAFDPNLHYAVVHVEDPQYGSNEVIEELQKGYTFKGKVIRPSMVRVAN